MLNIDIFMTQTRSEKDGGATQNPVYTKDQTIQAEWLSIQSNVLEPVHAVLPAEVIKYMRHINSNKSPGSDDLNIIGYQGHR